MADLRNEYTQHIQNTAPDMDKLWDRISNEIDKKENTQTTETANEEKHEQIRRSGGYMRIAAIAAAFIVVFAGVNIVNESKKAQTAKNNIPTSRPEKTETAYENNADAVQTEQAAVEDKTDEQMEMQTEDDGTDGMTDEKAIDLTVKYDQLALADTGTVSFMANYVPNGDEFFVEKNVLEQTGVFADVKVLEADLSNEDTAVYVLEVITMYDKDGVLTDGSIIVESSTPYILQENREYLIPLKLQDDKYSIVFENAPQIEITLDGGAVFQNGWTALDDGARALEKDSLNVNDFYFDRMKFTSQPDIDRLITEWKNA